MKQEHKAPQAPAVGPAFAGIVIRESKNAVFGGEKGTVTIDTAKLPWLLSTFRNGMIQLALADGIARKEVVDQETFEKACIKAGTPDARHLKDASELFDAVEGENPQHTWEEVESFISSKYGWELSSRDLNGLLAHFVQKHAFEQAKPKSLLERA